jgi:hypothetical protein
MRLNDLVTRLMRFSRFVRDTIVILKLKEKNVRSRSKRRHIPFR